MWKLGATNAKKKKLFWRLMAARKVTDAGADSVNVYARGRPVKGGKNWHFLSRSGAIQVFHGRQLQAD